MTSRRDDVLDFIVRQLGVDGLLPYQIKLIDHYINKYFDEKENDMNTPTEKES